MLAVFFMHFSEKTLEWAYFHSNQIWPIIEKQRRSFILDKIIAFNFLKGLKFVAYTNRHLTERLTVRSRHGTKKSSP